MQLPQRQGDHRKERGADDLHDRLRHRGRPLHPGHQRTFRNAFATTNLARAATQPSLDELAGTCPVAENSDGDFYFCESGSSDLEPVFRQIAAETVGHSRLVEDL